jgi:hypothetical protein
MFAPLTRRRSSGLRSGSRIPPKETSRMLSALRDMRVPLIVSYQYGDFRLRVLVYRRVR